MGEFHDAANEGQKDGCHEGEFNGGGPPLAPLRSATGRS